MNTEIKDHVREFISNNFGSIYRLEIGDDDSLIEKGILDSTAVLEMLEFLEESYVIRIEDDEVIPENLDSLNRIELFVKRKAKSIGK